MPKIEVVDAFLNKIESYESENEITFNRVKSSTLINQDEENRHHVLKSIILDDGTEIQLLDNGFGVFTDNLRIVYGIVYDVETCESEGYSKYQDEDILGYKRLGYDYANYLE